MVTSLRAARVLAWLVPMPPQPITPTVNLSLGETADAGPATASAAAPARNSLRLVLMGSSLEPRSGLFLTTNTRATGSLMCLDYFTYLRAPEPGAAVAGVRT